MSVSSSGHGNSTWSPTTCSRPTALRPARRAAAGPAPGLRHCSRTTTRPARTAIAEHDEHLQLVSGQPHGALVAEVAGLTPGRVLDVGSGEGAEAIWLAEGGGDVTGLEVPVSGTDPTRPPPREQHVWTPQPRPAALLQPSSPCGRSLSPWTLAGSIGQQLNSLTSCCSSFGIRDSSSVAWAVLWAPWVVCCAVEATPVMVPAMLLAAVAASPPAQRGDLRPHVPVAAQRPLRRDARRLPAAGVPRARARRGTTAGRARHRHDVVAEPGRHMKGDQGPPPRASPLPGRP